ncbi:MAG: hypothetical protein QJR12_09535 [Mycobacterium sp.]|uniref:hypothetical protein n=1 Tax=Mycobacterium sp. TaxID=1785 RepID=UPI0026334B61|nr:hypothetical protein [Mycobacterium sp.]MDI3314502.1 hypothetical protein [Mycobacterium sp.]
MGRDDYRQVTPAELAEETRRAEEARAGAAGGLAEAAGYLEACRHFLRSALTDARWAEQHLSGARAARAFELGGRISDAIAYAERLAFVVEGDVRAELGGPR